MPIQLRLGADLDFVCRSTRVTFEDRKIRGKDKPYEREDEGSDSSSSVMTRRSRNKKSADRAFEATRTYERGGLGRQILRCTWVRLRFRVAKTDWKSTRTKLSCEK